MMLVTILVVLVMLCNSYELKMQEFSLSDMVDSASLWNYNAYWDEIKQIRLRNGEYITKKCNDALCLCQDAVSSEFYGCHEVQKQSHSNLEQVHHQHDSYSAAMDASNYLMEERPLPLGFDQGAATTVYEASALSKEFRTLFHRFYGHEASLEYKEYKGMTALVFSPFYKRYKKHFGLNQRELVTLHLYTRTPWARVIRRYWRYQRESDIPEHRKGMHVQVPMIAQVLYSATHKDMSATLIKNGMTLFMGFKAIDLPIRVGTTDKKVGDTLNGATFRGPWSSSFDVEVAEEYAGDECDGDWHIDAEVVGERGIVFQITIPAGTEDSRLGAIPIPQGISAHKAEREVLLFDLDGKYVKILKYCNDEPEFDLESESELSLALSESES
eukprot:410158_1